MTIPRLIDRQNLWESEAKDYEFSHTSMLDHWHSGYENARRTLDLKDRIINRRPAP